MLTNLMLRLLTYVVPLTLALTANAAEDNALPTLGDASSGIVSIQQEKEIGQQVMKSLRQGTPLLRDPVVEEYVNSAVYRLAPVAPLQDRDLTIVVIDNAALNAFAVPGGIVGVNTGLFLQAPSEGEFLSVMAHELAHLSQRHFARRVEQQQKTAPLAIAGMIAGVIIAATTGSDAGIATIAGSQALAVQNQLAFSRANEQEADRVGLQILYDAGLEPRDMPLMFEKMLRENRLQGKRPPEYLSTHPLTESRVADTRNRAEQYPVVGTQDNIEYHVMRARLLVLGSSNPQEVLQRFEERRTTAPPQSVDWAVMTYGTAIARLRLNQGEKALSLIDALLERYPYRLSFVSARGEALLAAKQADAAVKWADANLRRNPGNIPLTALLAKSQFEARNYQAAASLYEQLARERPANEDYWLMLSDSYGLAGRTIEVHRAKAEYHLMKGENRLAATQLREGLRKADSTSPVAEIMRQRLLDIQVED